MKLILACLIIANFLTALQLVAKRHENRLLFNQLQKLQQDRDTLDEKWGQFLLEQSALAQPHLIEEKATKQLNMYSPTSPEIIVIRP